ncbi:MAG TPA: DNA (cytosine-5-)-methyltransferase [Tepidisphaeraceae bacterium]|nr:DNA (cytosine-5-)-methyltransferase [Tepidisphaeraceae bacterium]
MSSLITTAGKDVRSIRRLQGLKIDHLADKARIGATLLRRIERGLAPLDASTAKMLSVVMNVSAASLLDAHTRLVQTAETGEGYATARPGREYTVAPCAQIPSGSLPILDLFCGTGGFSHGFEQTGRFSVCAGIDLLPDRTATFAANHSTAFALCGDICNIGVDKLLDGAAMPQVVIGGPPCQGFSSIRPFRNIAVSDRRNNLFEQFAIVVEACRPAWFVMENVVGLLTHKGAETLNAILSLFDEIGYGVTWKVLNAAYYGLPQRRERLVLVGSRNCRAKFNWPEPTHFLTDQRSMAGRHGQSVAIAPLFGSTLRPATTVMDAIHDLPPLESGQSSRMYRDDVRMTPYESSMRGRETSLTLHEATQHSAKMLKIIGHSGHNIHALPAGLVTSGFSSCYSRLEPDLPAVTLTVNFVHPASNKCIHPRQNRALTPREGARLQGFPDAFKFVGNRAQVVKQIGNAVPPLLGRVIAEALISSW